MVAAKVIDSDSVDPTDANAMAANHVSTFTTALPGADLSIGVVTVTCFDQSDPQEIPECDTNGEVNPVFGARFIITVTNPASFAVPDVVVTDQLNGAALRYFQDDAADTETSYNQTNGQWTISSIPANGSATLRLDANVFFCYPNPTTTSNSAAITSAGVSDPNTANNTAASGTIVSNECF